ncbi:hypothetical protein GTP23_22130 [Pseudoduganella sp. FT93W]|uniref:Uncharacterized protein n=1 Tax=Duganella fentianensis TaxID=2692177 RepID=A0A845I384_9BURK|nr:hypothetical protein [Duganella fentianensis]MYN47739.1 hypothetical protein [Duganella fentianensis]
MAPGISHSRFTHPIDSERPKGASRFEFLAPKLKRRVTLFDPFHVRLWALLESNPRVLRYCERPAYWHHDNRRQLADFWVKIGRREVCWIVTPTPQPARAGGLSADDDIGVRYVHVQDLAAHGVWIENWLRILPYLASNERFVSERLLLDVEQAVSSAPTLGQLERDFQPHDTVLVRTAVFMLLHKGRIKAKALRDRPLGPAMGLRRAST